MEVKINKEIRNYTESMFFGLSLRQFIFSVLACGVAVGLYFLLRPHFGTETLSWMCILGAAPFALIGFVKYNGMTAEQFLWAWIIQEERYNPEWTKGNRYSSLLYGTAKTGKAELCDFLQYRWKACSGCAGHY